MKDYLRAAWTNKYTRTGSALLLAGTAMTFLGEQQIIREIGFVSTYIGTAITAVTGFGRDTLQTYNRARKNIQEYGYLRTDFKEKYAAPCDKAGIKMAEKDLEKILEETNRAQHQAS